MVGVGLSWGEFLQYTLIYNYYYSCMATLFEIKGDRTRGMVASLRGLVGGGGWASLLNIFLQHSISPFSPILCVSIHPILPYYIIHSNKNRGVSYD